MGIDITNNKVKNLKGQDVTEDELIDEEARKQGITDKLARSQFRLLHYVDKAGKISRLPGKLVN